jgi:2-polyprenyl-3-methyl-5-hydroxy-6-metoxy-1,4-benzoquinol methylase
MGAGVKKNISALRGRFDEIYNSRIIGGGFVESDEYYRRSRERYWRSLELLDQFEIPSPAKILEIGGGQIALLRKNLFGDDCTVGDISDEYTLPVKKDHIKFMKYNLMGLDSDVTDQQFDLVILLEVIEHIPLPAHVIFERIKSLLSPKGILFLTTPNLFRLRNLIRMFLGREFLDRFTIAEPGKPLGHQLEYSADQMRWQLHRAGMDIVMLKHDRLGRKGHTVAARFGRAILWPLELRPIWRDGLAVAAVHRSPN